MKRLWLGLMLLMMCSFATAQTTVGLTGTIDNPDGSGVNGYLKIKLTKSGVRNICTPPPYQLVPMTTATFNIVNGSIQNGTAAAYTQTDCLSPRVPYYVEIYDSTNRMILSDNWYAKVPDGATNLDVGLLAQANFGGPITVSIPQAIVWNPTAAQTITQPNGTYLSVNNLQVTNSLLYTGSLTLSVGTLTAQTLAITANGSITGNLTIGGTLSVTGATTLATLTATTVDATTSLTTPEIFDTGLTANQFVCAVSGGELATSGCPSALTLYYQVMENNGSAVTQEHAMNYIEGSGIALSFTDTSGTSTNMTISATGVQSAYAGTGTATFAAGGALGSGAATPYCNTGTPGHVCDSVSGEVVAVSTASPDVNAATMMTITLGGVTRTNFPNCVVNGYNYGSAFHPSIEVFANNYTTTTFDVWSQELSSSTTYVIDYFCGGN